MISGLDRRPSVRLDLGGEIRALATLGVVDCEHEPPTRFESLPVRQLFGIEFPVAIGLGVRLRGLAFLDRDRAGPGLLIPRCRSIHTFGMRFPLAILFLTLEGTVLAIHPEVLPGRVLMHRRAWGVLEVALPLDGSLPDGSLAAGGREILPRD